MGEHERGEREAKEKAEREAAKDREERRAKEAADEKAMAEAAEKARREIEQESKKQKEVEEIKGRGEESKLGRKEAKENEVDADIDTVRAKEEAKAKAPHGFFNGVRPDSSKCTTIGRLENVKEEAESKLERERRLIEK